MHIFKWKKHEFDKKGCDQQHDQKPLSPATSFGQYFNNFGDMEEITGILSHYYPWF